jgi:hypothetical protein
MPGSITFAKEGAILPEIGGRMGHFVSLSCITFLAIIVFKMTRITRDVTKITFECALHG